MGDTVDYLGHRFTVAAVDGHRVARVRITPLTPANGEHAQP